MRRIFGWVFFFGFLAVSCSKQETEILPLDFGYEYYPLEVGREYYYEADSITFRVTTRGIETDSIRFFIREIVTDTFTDVTGLLLYRIERSERSRESDPWRLRAAYTAARTNRQAIRNEDNLRFIKLVFPLEEGARWDGNRFFPSGIQQVVAGDPVEVFREWDYRLLQVDAPETIGGQAYDSVATVSMANFESLIEIRRAEEKYARGVGLVFRELLIMDTQCQGCCQGNTSVCQSLDWRRKAEAGFIFRQWLVDRK